MEDENSPPRRWRQMTALLLLAPVTLFLAVFFIVPLASIVGLSLGTNGLSLASYVAFFRDELYLVVLLRTLYVALVVTCLCLVLGYPVAYVAARHGGGWAQLLLLVVTMSFWTSFLIRTYAWMVILGTQGPIAWLARLLGLPAPNILFTSTAAFIGIVHILLPFMVLSLYSVMVKIDHRLPRAARVLGASPLRAFWTVYFPLSLPGVINGTMLVFIICIGFYVTPELLGGPKDQMIARLIGAQIEQLLDWQEASTMAIVLLVITLSLFALYDRFFGLDRLWRA
jgi:putative spermidine/putrescine transport system permease protein